MVLVSPEKLLFGQVEPPISDSVAAGSWVGGCVYGRVGVSILHLSVEQEHGFKQLQLPPWGRSKDDGWRLGCFPWLRHK